MSRRKKRPRLPDRTPTIPAEAAAEMKRSLVLEALRVEDFNRTRAARRLGYKHPGDFFRLLRTLDMRLPKGRTGRPKAEVAAQP